MTIAVREMRDISAKLEVAKGERNLERVRQIAHQLKGLAATFGTPEVLDLVNRLEDEARQHSALELSQELSDLCADVVKATLAVIQTGAGTRPARVPVAATGR
jgi:HPt (histidine-containing phosphotransfer) domain-containing protein